MKRSASHWYHCTEDNHGPRWVARRIAPRLGGSDEPSTPRLCVAATPVRCFAARLFTRNVYVYRTETPRRAIRPLRVWDSVITQERWLIPPVAMLLVDVVPWNLARRISGPTVKHIRVHESVNVSVRAGDLSRAVEVLGKVWPEWVRPADRRFVDGLTRLLEERGALPVGGAA